MRDAVSLTVDGTRGMLDTSGVSGVFRILAGYVVRAAVVAGPLIAPYVFGALGLSLRGPDKDKIAGAAVSLMALTAVLLVDLFDHGIPRFDAVRFREQYLTELVETHFPESRGHLRFNVMILRREWRLLWIFKTFQWDANQGFEQGHLDVKLRFLWFQGVCGRAVRKRKAVFCEDLRSDANGKLSWAFWNNPYYLFPPQLRKTAEVLAIFSLPLMVRRGTGGNPHFSRPVGVLNVDAVSPEGAKWLAEHWEKMKKPLVKSARFLAVSG